MKGLGLGSVKILRSATVRSCVIIFILSLVPTASPLLPGASALSSESIEITWQPPPLPDQNGVITGYVVNVTSLDSAVIQQISTTATNTLLVSGLSPFTVYSCIIAARTAVGLGPYTTVVTVQTLEAGKWTTQPFLCLTCLTDFPDLFYNQYPCCGSIRSVVYKLYFHLRAYFLKKSV